ncbi:META domain-containing protein [Flavobacterium sp. Fl-318]|uniref:META domain-containing protein n=1 Tax=Flavobacterium cupriresistens TaxID=2893885 RepID=A0ABU4RGM0_9FLAO|nr:MULTISPECIES: META domain-containing protein [unclassified Flavobacterium]MDX6191720.1 META domain-containing protein [Flavobacterium sp. Fl-318]UFH41664.1 META domain-containing protein [Flavobacterium sp. F-323]
MKNYVIAIVAISTVFFSSCKASKETKSTANIYDTTWELEYISGPRIAFDGLFPNKKPQLTFDQKETRVYGNNGCNGYSASYTLEGKKLSFGEAGPTTMMFCDGGGEQQFLQQINKITSYTIDKEGKLNLNEGDVPMMRFKKVAK